MGTYLKFHHLERSPFEGEPGERLVLATESLRRAYAEIKSGLDQGSPRICVSGGPGIGKSSLARALPRLLANEASCALIRDPSVDWSRVKAKITRQLSLDSGQISRRALLATRTLGRRVVIIIDQAEQLPAESLEHLDTILGYRDEAGEQLIQCVLLANLDAAPRGAEVPLLWWLDQLTTRQLTFSPIPEAGIRSYVDKHLKKAGLRAASLFRDDAVVAIHRYTGGVPGAVSALCEQLLAKAAEHGRREIGADLVANLFGDAELADEPIPVRDEPDDALPHFEAPRAPAAGSRVPATGFGRAEPEPELEIQQGYLPIEDSNYANERDFFADAPRKHTPRMRSESQRYATEALSSRRGGTRLAGKLRTLALLAVLAAALHAWWSNDAPGLPEIPEMPFSLPFLSSETKPARKAHPPKPPVPPKPPRTASAGEPGPMPAGANGPGDEAPDGVRTADADGLTSDLMLDGADSNPASVADAAHPVEAADPAAVTPTLSLGELYDIAESEAESAKDEPPAYEPWSQQAPEGPPAAPASAR